MLTVQGPSTPAKQWPPSKRQSALTARCAGSAENADHQTLPHGKAIALLYPMARPFQCSVDLAGDIQLLCQTQQRRHRPCCSRRDFEVGVLLLCQAQDVLDADEVGDHPETRFSVLTEGLEDAAIASSVRLIL